MNEFEFDRLLELYKKNRLTPEERKMVDDWLQQMDSVAASPLTDADKNRLKNNILHRIRHSADIAPVTAQELSSSSFYSGAWLKIAASVLVVFLIGFVAWRFVFTPEQLNSYVSNGTITKVTLSDGTLVWLKGESTLLSPSSFDGETRNVILKGEALFEVAKDPRHPFVIQCGEVTTTVLGTSFNLRSLNERVELTVLTGKVSLTSHRDADGVVVLPNEKVIYDPVASMISKQNLVADQKNAATDGTEYEMVFNDVALGKVFERIENKFGVKILLNNEALRNCKIRADFSDQSLEDTLDMISQALGFRYTITDKNVRLTGDACS